MLLYNSQNRDPFDGENHNAESEDNMLASLASEKFGISTEKAGQIYENVSIRINSVQQERLKRNEAPSGVFSFALI